jgi:hypothetical protein
MPNRSFHIHQERPHGRCDRSVVDPFRTAHVDSKTTVRLVRGYTIDVNIVGRFRGL